MRPSPLAPTLGLEEELHVVELPTGRLVSRARELLTHLGSERHAPDVADGAVVAELTLSQLETVTTVSGDVEELVRKARSLRTAAARAARAHGLGLLASGTPLLGAAADQRVAEDDRYRALRERAAALVTQQLIAGMHVHVGTSDQVAQGSVDDDERVAVVGALRPWLPVLTAITANSPFWLGVDTGFASYRQVHWQRWPVAGPPPPVPDARGWHEAVRAVVATGVVDDPSFVYWDVRLATRFPTVEVRVADVAADLADVATFVALVRAVAARALLDHRAAQARPGYHDVPLHVLRAAIWRAARYGLDDRLVHPLTAGTAPAGDVVRAFADHLAPGLEATGDGDLVRDGLRRLAVDGNGATRQRRAFARGGWPMLVEQLLVAAGTDGPAATPPPPHTQVGDGNGWVDCGCGGRHWGRNGAAGLLVVRPGVTGPEVLLQLRAGWTHQGGTWALPGGARDSHETVQQAARREAHEEVALAGTSLQEIGLHVEDHGSWSYTYVLVSAAPGTTAAVANDESDAVAWVPLQQVQSHPLHPAFRAQWPVLHQQVLRSQSATTTAVPGPFSGS